MNYDERTLNAYIDGELDSAQAAAIARAEADDAELRARLDALRQSDRVLREACEPIAERPLPAAVTEMLADATGTRARQPSFRLADTLAWLAGPLKSLPLPATGIAAGAVVGLVAAYLVLAPGERGGTTLPGRIESGTALYAALQQQPSGSTTNVDGRTLQPLLSFRSSGGDYCREFILAGNTQRRHAVACAGANAWRVQASVELPGGGGESEGYIPAAGESGNAVGDFVDEHMAGIPLDRTRERALIESGWQQPDQRR